MNGFGGYDVKEYVCDFGVGSELHDVTASILREPGSLTTPGSNREPGTMGGIIDAAKHGDSTDDKMPPYDPKPRAKAP